MAESIDIAEPAIIRHTSLEGLGFVLNCTALLYVTYLTVTAVHSIYFHPLSSIPGPKLWIAVPFVRWISSIRGCMDAETRSYHSIYGPTIRVSPTELSFTSSAAWDDIYGFKNSPELQKYQITDPNRPSSIITGDSRDHGRFRKALSHGFSDKALRDQEPLLRGYVDMLISRLRHAAEENEVANLERWYNFTTFDLIGDLALGQSFSCLRNGTMHRYLSSLLDLLKTVPVIRGAKDFPILMYLLRHVFLTKKTQESRDHQWQFAGDCIRRRLDDGNQRDRPDFVDSMMRHKGTGEEITEEEMVSNALILLLAGSETTASLLTGLTYHLLKTPRALELATNEVRDNFQSEDDITIASVSAKCPYLFACLQEGLRIYPPLPTSTPRVTSQPVTTIAGIQVPAGTRVGVHHSAAYWAPANFTRPRDFAPERWLAKHQKEGAEFARDDRAVLQAFSYGPRNCIGKNLAYAEMRLILARALWTFDMQLEGDHDGWENQPIFQIWIKKPLLVRLAVREGA